MAERDITAEIKPHVPQISRDAEAGDTNAQGVIKYHRMHVASPGDPGAYAFCCEAFDAWKGIDHG